MSNYHIIGDIHGHADKLEALLLHLGYEKTQGVYQHNDAKVVFLGDFVDRGRQHRQLLDIVRPMVERGHALAVMGNHEFNAIAYHTRHPETADPLRPHSEKNTEQHQEFLDEYALDDEDTQDVIAWFMTLPLYLEIPNDKTGNVLFRAVHVCWHEDIVGRTKPYLTGDYLVHASEKGTPEYEDIEVMLKGPEVTLPDGHTFCDKSNIERHNVRLKWWLSPHGKSFRDMAMVPAGEKNNIPNEPLPDSGVNYVYPDGASPVFIGHYWLTGEPAILAHNVACLDYSACRGGSLVAYDWEAGTLTSGALSNAGFTHAA